MDRSGDALETDFGALEGRGYNADGARQTFARKLSSVSDASMLLSDRLSLRHFSHIDLDLHTVTA